MTKLQIAQAERFANLCEQYGIELTPENILKCIGFAKEAMLAGECSVEAYYSAKQILLQKVEVTSKWVN